MLRAAGVRVETWAPLADCAGGVDTAAASAAAATELGQLVGYLRNEARSVGALPSIATTGTALFDDDGDRRPRLDGRRAAQLLHALAVVHGARHAPRCSNSELGAVGGLAAQLTSDDAPWNGERRDALQAELQALQAEVARSREQVGNAILAVKQEMEQRQATWADERRTLLAQLAEAEARLATATAARSSGAAAAPAPAESPAPVPAPAPSTGAQVELRLQQGEDGAWKVSLF